MSLNNQHGAEGNDFEYIAKNRITTIGAGCPNLAMSVRTDLVGKMLPKIGLSKNVGSVPIRSATPSASVIDTSVTHPRGTWSLCIGSRWNITVGSGGISTKSSGPLMTTSPYVLFMGENQLSLHSGTLVEIKSGNTIMIDAPRVCINTKDMVMNNTLVSNSNIVANGGFYARGETYITHMTTQGQLMETKESAPVTSYIDPSQSFAVAGGNSNLARLKMGASYSKMISAITSGSLPNQDGYIEMIIALPLPAPIDSVLTLPAKVAFPYGIRLISDGLYGKMPAKAIKDWSTRPDPSYGISNADTASLGHKHMFIGPAANYTDNTQQLYAAAANSGVMSSTPLGHDGVDNGAGSWLKDYAKNLWNQFAKPIPFGGKPTG